MAKNKRTTANATRPNESSNSTDWPTDLRPAENVSRRFGGFTASEDAPEVRSKTGWSRYKPVAWPGICELWTTAPKARQQKSPGVEPLQQAPEMLEFESISQITTVVPTSISCAIAGQQVRRMSSSLAEPTRRWWQNPPLARAVDALNFF